MKTLEQEIAEAVVELRGCAATEDKESREAGMTAGAKFAGNCMKRQLRKLARAVEFSDERGHGHGDAESYVGAVEHVAHTLYELLDVDGDSFNGFWSNALSQGNIANIYDEAFAIGFVEGMLAVYEASQSVAA